jgi:murein DD-endopeptidase MepM/ murein hydrolase activator NlpD
VFDTVKDALKKGGEIALRWALAEFKKLVGGGNVIKDMAVGAFEWASEKMFAFGRDQDQAAAAAAAAAASSTGSGPAAVWRALRSVGFSKVQTAGIMGSMQSESHFDPTIVQGGGHSMNPAAAGSMGYGLVQWTPGAKLIPYLGGKAPSINTEISALAAQLAGHGSSPEGAAGKALRSATTVVEAARAFELGYERHAGPPQASRITQAMAWYKKFKGSDAMEAAGAAPYTGAPGGWAYPIPKTNVTYNWDGHSPASALDMHAVEGTPVHALSSGNISFAIAPGRSYGNYLTIAHAGDWQSRYAHLQRAVRKSGRVRAGELIAFSGHTGGVPAHLHLELAKHVGIKNYPDTHTELVRRGLRYPYSPTGSRGPFHFALGGVAQATPGGVLSLLAEAGKSERVTPLDNQGFTPAERAMLERLEATLGGGGNGDTYHVHPTPGMDETALADKVSRRVAWNRRRGVRRP